MICNASCLITHSKYLYFKNSFSFVFARVIVISSRVLKHFCYSWNGLYLLCGIECLIKSWCRMKHWDYLYRITCVLPVFNFIFTLMSKAFFLTCSILSLCSWPFNFFGSYFARFLTFNFSSCLVLWVLDGFVDVAIRQRRVSKG